MAILKKTSSFVVNKLEQLFYRWGCFVSKHPERVIIGCLVITALTALGFFNISVESRADQLWISPKSPYISNKQWLDTNFPRNLRHHSALFVAEENILTPDSLLHMLELHNKVLAIKADNKTWTDLCYRIPIADIFLTKRRKKRQIAIVNTTFVVKRSPNPQQNVASAVQNTERIPKLINDDLTNPRNQKSDLESSYELFQDDSYSYFDDYNYDYIEDFEEDPVSDAAIQDQVDILDDIPDDIYCSLVETLNEKCLETSLLEIWKYNEKMIKGLTQEKIIEAVNVIKQSPHFGHNFDYSKLLGDITRDEQTGQIISAKSALHVWVGSINASDLSENDSGGLGVELELADPTTLHWENELIKTLLDFDASMPDMSILVNVARSFQDISSSAIFFDGVKMAAGWLLMFMYTVFMLGRVNLVEHRTYLTAAGIFAVAMGLIMSIGLTAMISLPYSPMHAILPFLCLGIGIDDMFVIVQCWYNLSEEEKVGKSLHEQIGETMKHAGVAITVTSITDVFAFGIGAVTILPGLQSFCVAAAVAIGSIYLLQSSWFVAWLSIDQRRISKKQDGLIPCCMVHQEFGNSSNKGQENWAKNCLSFCANLVRIKAFKVVVLVLTIGFISVGTLGTLRIRQHFDPVLLLPADTYLRQWIGVHQRHFPQDGWVADIYTGKLDPITDLEKIDRLVTQLQTEAEKKTILKGVDAWWTNFKTYLAESRNLSDWRSILKSFDKSETEIKSPFEAPQSDNNSRSKSSFEFLLSQFLFSRHGSKFKRNFRFDGNLTCNQPAPPIKATQFSITYLPFSGPEQHIPGRKTVTDLIEKANISSHTFSFSKVYAAWETDEVIGFELWRNLGLALVCVFVITLMLLANIPICMMVLLCVALTLVDMVGMLHFWDLTIDTLSCINIVLAIGLCVDYSAHIAHAYIVSEGTREERAVSSLLKMGPAIVNGGITTFLALLLLGFSQSHVFITFFKVFLLTVAFGLFHGVVFFPVLLSLCGPDNDNALDNGQVGQTSAAAASVEVAGEDPSSASTATTAIEMKPGNREQYPQIVQTWFPWRTKKKKGRVAPAEVSNLPG